ncbi:hypothetical protein Tco_0067692 [Tanacetum coccineum]
MEANDQAIQTILMGLPEDVYAAVDSCDTTQEIGLHVEQMMKGSSIGLMNDFSRNKHFLEKIASNLKFLNNLQLEWQRSVTTVHQTKDLHEFDYIQLYDFLKFNQVEVDAIKAKRLARTHDPTTAMNMSLILMAKAFKLNYSTPTNNNQIISSNPRNRQIDQPDMNIGQDRQIQMVGGNCGNQFRKYARQNARNQIGYNAGQFAWNQNGYNVVQNVGNLVGQNAAHSGYSKCQKSEWAFCFSRDC